MPGITWSSSEVTGGNSSRFPQFQWHPAQTESESSDTAAAVQGKPKPRKTFTELLPQGISRRPQRSRTYPSGYSKICEQENHGKSPYSPINHQKSSTNEPWLGYVTNIQRVAQNRQRFVGSNVVCPNIPGFSNVPGRGGAPKR